MSLAASYSIAAVFTAKDRLSPAIRAIEKRYGSFAGNVGRTLGRLDKGINKVLKVGATAALAGIVAGTVAATREFIKFDQAVVGANVRFKDFVAGSKESEQTLQDLKDAARAVGKTTQFTATEAAQGLNFYAKAGFSAAEAMAVLEDTVNLATVAEADFNRTADISSDLLGALGKNAQDSATKIQNLKDINRALGITANSANVDIEDMFETLKIAGPIATKAGESMHQLFAITGALGGAGIKGTQAATALKNAYINLAAPTKTVTSALDQLGLKQADFIDQSGKMKSMVTIMGMIGKASKGMGEQEQLAIFSEIFGKRAVAGALNLADSLSQVEEIMLRLEGETKLKDLADEIRKGLGMQVQILISGVKDLGFQFVESFEKDGRGGLERLITAVQNFDMTPVTESVKNLVGFLKSMATFVMENDGLIKGLAITMLVFKAAVIATNIVMGIHAGFMAVAPVFKFIKVIASLAKTEGILATAQLFLNTSMLASPIFWIPAAIIAVIALMVILQKKFQIFTKISDFFKKFKTENPEFGDEPTEEQKQAGADRGYRGYAPNAAQEESRQMQITRGRGTITVKSEDGTPLEVDSGNMNDTGWDMQTLGRDGA
ncbi:phage tail tape measure protein [bacterium]|nr:phage tail tape measure protein [bacterium]